ncbi:hypothetical protein KY284_036251 [Solanum tuberosum]|nr:hypothetical protein KY284_036251 [Solanum tuberosum]
MSSSANINGHLSITGLGDNFWDIAFLSDKDATGGAYVDGGVGE